MPLSSYTLLHQDAVLNETQKKDLITWINSKLENEQF